MSMIKAPHERSPEELRRAVHTLKGNADVMGLRTIAQICHDLETNALSVTASTPTAADREPLVRAWQTLAGCRRLIGERSDRIEIERSEYFALVTAAESAPRAEWQRAIYRLALEPTARRLRRAADQATALATRLGKPGLGVVIDANGVRLPGATWAPFWSAFVHLVRNAVDHGIELPEVRSAAGKPPHGRLTLRTVITAGDLTVEITDDGRGIDWARVAVRASRAGHPCDTQQDLEAALFQDGISTADEVTHVSGRGVGLGAVRDACEALGGTTSITSVAGAGATFRFRFPGFLARPLIRPHPSMTSLASPVSRSSPPPRGPATRVA